MITDRSNEVAAPKLAIEYRRLKNRKNRMLNKKLKFTLYQFIINYYISKTDWILGVYWILIFIIMLTNSTYLNDLNIQTNPSIFNIFFMFYFPIWLICQISGWFTSSSFNKIDLSKSNKLILSRILLKKHNLSSLNLELDKLTIALNNKSSLYNDLYKKDFPSLFKLITRYGNIKNKLKKINKQKPSVEQLKIQVDINNLCKLDSKQNTFDKHADVLLLTMDNLDEKLNDVINHQFNVVASSYKIKLPIENNINK